MKNHYEDWTEIDHKQGFKVTYSDYEATDYKKWGSSDNSDDWHYMVHQAKYQPKGYWGTSIITVEVSREGVKFSRSSGGDTGDLDGLKQMEHFANCLEHAKLFVKHTTEQLIKENK